jgi:hypothetical protein
MRNLVYYFTGTYGCVIISAGMPTANKSILHTNFSLRVYSGSVISEPLKIPFLPAVYVHTKQVNLSDARMSTYVTISGRPDVLRQLKVSWNTPYNVNIFIAITVVHFQVHITTKLI